MRINFLARAAVMVTVSALALSCMEKKQQEDTPRHPGWSYDAVIYELNTRQFTPEGTFAAAQAHLDRLEDLGVDIIWFMPIQPIGEQERKGTLGSYYSIYDYTAVNPEFGTLADFRSFVDSAHARGMRVIIDWVANHTSRDAVWIEQGKDDWYVKDEDGVIVGPYDWTDVAKLDYDNPQVRRAMGDAMAYWLREAGIDGFRCDVAAEVPTDFWDDVVVELKEIKPDLFMLAEAEKDYLHGAFDMTYAWDLHKVMNEVAQGELGVDDLRRQVDRDRREFPDDAIRMIFTSNHDENSWNGTEFERMGDAAQAMAVLSYTLPGMPLVYNGQEVGFDRRLEFFEKDSIDWVEDSPWTQLYRSLNRLRHDNKALWSPEKGGELVELQNDSQDQVYSFFRSVEDNTVAAVFNFSPETVIVNVMVDNIAGRYRSFTGNDVHLVGEIALNLAPWQYEIFIK